MTAPTHPTITSDEMHRINVKFLAALSVLSDECTHNLKHFNCWQKIKQLKVDTQSTIMVRDEFGTKLLLIDDPAVVAGIMNALVNLDNDFWITLQVLTNDFFLNAFISDEDYRLMWDHILSSASGQIIRNFSDGEELGYYRFYYDHRWLFVVVLLEQLNLES
jgi:hypothetical protein